MWWRAAVSHMWHEVVEALEQPVGAVSLKYPHSLYLCQILRHLLAVSIRGREASLDRAKSQMKIIILISPCKIFWTDLHDCLIALADAVRMAACGALSMLTLEALHHLQMQHSAAACMLPGSQSRLVHNHSNIWKFWFLSKSLQQVLI